MVTATTTAAATGTDTGAGADDQGPAFLVFAGRRQLECLPQPLEGLYTTLPPHVRTECSLASTGTELKFFRGDFETDPEEEAALDTSIAGMNVLRVYL